MKKISLTKGMIAFVDDDDFEFINQWKWYAKSNGKNRNGFYAARSFHFRKDDGKLSSRTIFMHRIIMSVNGNSFREIEIDHVDHNGLNNTKINLRKSSRSQNCINRRKSDTTLIKYRGVVKTQSNRYGSIIKINQKTLRIGTFDTIEEAAKAYDLKAKELHGQFANLNFG